jgi:hypothetical protein
MVKVHAPVPVQAPPQPAKVDVASGVGVRVTVVPAYTDARHVTGQLIACGCDEDVTDPLPVPLKGKAMVNACSIRLNVAVTDLDPLIVTTHGAVPVQPPLHPSNVEVASGVAVRVTSVPVSNTATQLVPQSIPEGTEATVPPPVPALDTLNPFGISK